MLIKGAEINNGNPIDLRCHAGHVSEMGDWLKAHPGEIVIDARACALLPGLHDHHLHLYACAAAQNSIFCGPPSVHCLAELIDALKNDPGHSGWLRGVGYHESVAGPLDRWQLDKIEASRPVRIQHRSGKLWIINSCAIDLLKLDSLHEDPSISSSIERDAKGRATGRLLRLDNWLREKLATGEAPNLSVISRELARFGVTGVTDATPTNSTKMVELLTHAIEKKELLQRVLLMGDAELPEPKHPLLTRGPLKILLDEHNLPEFEHLKSLIYTAHNQLRAVAIHCVTETELIFALSALVDTGHFPGDRIEHASIAPDAAFELMQKAMITVVTQPGFIQERGDQYLREVQHKDQPLLYRCRTLLEKKIPLGGSTDAPFGHPDPWAAMTAAVRRNTRSGSTIGKRERLTPEQACALFTSAPESPGKGPRIIKPGSMADFCILTRTWAEARKRLTAEDVAFTIRGGELIYQKPNIPNAV